MRPPPTVNILLATYNGARYLTEQLQSIYRQTHSDWTLTVSDDGSTDRTLDIVQSFAEQVTQPVTVLQGPMLGSSTANFCQLLAKVPADNVHDLYAFCDQDDVWHDEKLRRAVNWHTLHPNQTVRLYCGRTQFVNERLEPIGFSPGIKRPPSFGNALVQNIASGNTMVFSHAVLMAQRKVHPAHSVWHDWTTYIVATALGGLVCFDDKPCLLYRQHAGNVIGSNDGLHAQISRLKPLLEGRFKLWTDMNCAAMDDLNNLPIPESIAKLTEFKAIRTSLPAFIRAFAFLKSDIRRQRTPANLLLALALVFKLG